MSAIKYRPEVDGLRAVAVIPVVLFHLGASWIPGGFIGVYSKKLSWSILQENEISVLGENLRLVFLESLGLKTLQETFLEHAPRTSS